MMMRVLLLLVVCSTLLARVDVELSDEDDTPKDADSKEVEFNYEDDVLVLDEGNYFQALDKFEYMLLDFYAPWCGHCQKLEPEYAKAAKALKDDGIVLAKCDASVHRKLSTAQGCTGYPTLKFLTQGKEIPFEGGRTSDGIQQWIWNHINPGSEQLNSTSEIQDAIDQNEVLFFYFADVQQKDEKDRDLRRYKEFSYTIKATKFAHTHEQNLKQHFKVPKNINFLVFKKTDQRVAMYNNKLKIAEMKNSQPRVLNLDDHWDTLKVKIFSKDRAAVIHFSQGDDQQEEYFKLAAFAYPSEELLAFVQVESEAINRKDLLELLQVRAEDAQGFFIVSKNGTLKYKLLEAQDQNDILSFISDYKDGQAPRYFRSQSAPQDSKGPVKSLVGETYQNEVLNSKQDIVVLYYDSKNEEHLSVQKQFESVAARLQKSDLKFAKIDISKNEVSDMQENVEVTKVRLYSGSSPREHVKFVLRANKIQDERLVKWIRDHSKNEVADPKGDL